MHDSNVADTVRRDCPQEVVETWDSTVIKQQPRRPKRRELRKKVK
jgi:hypothetical protein